MRPGHRRTIILLLAAAGTTAGLLQILSASLPPTPTPQESPYSVHKAVAYSAAYEAALPPLDYFGFLDAEAFEEAIAANLDLQDSVNPAHPESDGLLVLLEHQRRLLAWYLQYGPTLRDATSTILAAFGSDEDSLLLDHQEGLQDLVFLLEDTRINTASAAAYRLHGIGATPGWLSMDSQLERLLQDIAQRTSSLMEVVQPHATWFQKPASSSTASGAPPASSVGEYESIEVTSLAAVDVGLLHHLRRASAVDRVAQWLSQQEAKGSPARSAEVYLGAEALYVCGLTTSGGGERRYCPEEAPGLGRVLRIDEDGGLRRVGVGAHEVEGVPFWFVRNAEPADLEDVQLRLVLPNRNSIQLGHMEVVAAYSTSTLPVDELAYEGPAVLTVLSAGVVVQEVEGFVVADFGWLR